MRKFLKYFASLSIFILFIQCNSTSTATAPEMVNVDGGSFNMGNDSSTAQSDQKPVRNVTITGFKIAKYPTTVAEYKAFCAATNHTMPNKPTWGWDDNSPIIDISYDDAVAYCNWLSTKFNGHYRLPTEAEWEYAARGGNKTSGFIYSGGNNIAEVSWYSVNSKGMTHPVGLKKPNELGIYDMSGNVWEWCSDWYGPYSPSNTSNPKGPGSGADRILRGGSWRHETIHCQVSYRGHTSPSDHGIDCGFRVASSM